MKLSVKLMEFHFFFKAFVAYIIINYVDLQIAEEMKDALDAAWTDWDPKFNAYTNPNTHGSITISDINLAYNEYYPISENVKTSVRDNPNIVLSGADYKNLDIKPRKNHPTPIEAPDFQPSVATLLLVHLLARFFVFDPQNPTKKAKPDGAKMIGYAIAFTLVDGPEPTRNDYATQVPSGKTIIDVIYDLSKVGKKMWLIAWYISPTGKTSPESTPISVVLV